MWWRSGLNSQSSVFLWFSNLSQNGWLNAGKRDYLLVRVKLICFVSLLKELILDQLFI